MSNKLEKRIEELTKIVERLASSPVAPVAPVLPVAPVAPIAPIIMPHTGDHDTLTGLAADMKTVKGQISAISDKLDNKYTTKEEHKAVVAIQIDHESRIRTQEKIQEGSTGTMSLTTKIVFGACAIVLTAVLSGLVYLVVK